MASLSTAVLLIVRMWGNQLIDELLEDSLTTCKLLRILFYGITNIHTFGTILSWLAFNWRVLHMALDVRTPLLEVETLRLFDFNSLLYDDMDRTCKPVA